MHVFFAVMLQVAAPAAQTTPPSTPGVQVAPPAASASPTPPTPSELIAPVPGTKLTVRLDIPGFTSEERHAKALKQALGPRGVFVGVLPSEGANLELVIDPEPEHQPHMTDTEWRDFNLKDAGASWKYFEGAGFLCGEASLFFEGSGSHDMDAFTVRGGQRITFHMSESWDASRKPHLTRPRFLEILSTFRLAAVRLGTWSDQAPQAIEAMNRALCATSAREALADLAKASPDDFAFPLAAAELAVAAGRPAAEAIEIYSKAVEILAAKKEPDAVERFAFVLCEEGLAVAYSETKDREKSIARFERAQKLGEGLPARIRAAILFDRARAEVHFGLAETALQHLQDAEKIESGAVVRALADKDFAPLRELPWVKNFLAGDR